MDSVSLSVCFDYDVELQAPIQLTTVMTDHLTAVIFTAQPLNAASSPSFSSSHRSPETRRIFRIPPPQLPDAVFISVPWVWE